MKQRNRERERERERVGNIYLFTDTKKGAFVHELIEESLTHQYIIFKRNRYNSVRLIERASERVFVFVFAKKSEELRDRERIEEIRKRMNEI